MTTTATVELPDTVSGVLAFAREQRAAADLAERRLLEAAVAWAVMHPAESVEEAETFACRVHVAGADDQGMALAGPGTPLVAEFSVAEFAAAIGMGTESGKHYLGQAVELRYRLPRLWARVIAGDLPTWKARRVADATIGAGLSREAAGFVDRHVGPVAHKVRPFQLQRLVDEAIARFMPDRAEEIRRRAADGRHFTIDHDQVSFAGTSLVTGELDLADALDLDDAVRGIAGQLANLGSTESLDVRRAVAVGELARRQLALDLTTPTTAIDGAGPAPGRSRGRRVRRVVLYLHLSEAALKGAGQVARVENTRAPVTVEQARAWCGHPDAVVTVKPVVDLEEHVGVDQYEVPDRIGEVVALRDGWCVFPWCTRPARRLEPDGHGCDCDHITPYAQAGVTCSCQLAPLCRRHHRLKTHSGWRYTPLDPGTYLWSSPHGYQYLRDHTGILDVSRDRRPPPGPPPDRPRP